MGILFSIVYIITLKIFVTKVGIWKGNIGILLLQVFVLHQDSVIDGGEYVLWSRAHEELDVRRCGGVACAGGGVARSGGGRAGARRGGQRSAEHARAQQQLTQPRHHAVGSALR